MMDDDDLDHDDHDHDDNDDHDHDGGDCVNCWVGDNNEDQRHYC